VKARHTFASRVFLVAGIYGLVALLPQYFMEDALSRNFPPALTHPEHFYGFIGVAIAWQWAFLLIARDVSRFRLFMLPATLEKLSFGAATLILYAQTRVALLVACAGTIDLVLAAFFILAFRASRSLED
jgi:hypothetical protein